MAYGHRETPKELRREMLTCEETTQVEALMPYAFDTYREAVNMSADTLWASLPMPPFWSIKMCVFYRSIRRQRICQRVKQIHDRAISLAQYFGRKRVEAFPSRSSKVRVFVNDVSVRCPMKNG